MTTIKIACAECGKKFVPTRAGQKFHSTACRMKAAHEQRNTTTKKLRKQLNAARVVLAEVEMFLDSSKYRSSDEDDLYAAVRRVLHGRKAPTDRREA